MRRQVPEMFEHGRNAPTVGYLLIESCSLYISIQQQQSRRQMLLGCHQGLSHVRVKAVRVVRLTVSLVPAEGAFAFLVG